MTDKRAPAKNGGSSLFSECIFASLVSPKLRGKNGASPPLKDQLVGGTVVFSARIYDEARLAGVYCIIEVPYSCQGKRMLK